MFTGALNDSCSEKSEAVQQSCFLGNHILKTFSKFTEEHPCWSVISIKLLICGTLQENIHSEVTNKSHFDMGAPL